MILEELSVAPRVALIGPEIEENLGLRYLSTALVDAGFEAEILRFDDERDFATVLKAILEPPGFFLVALSLAFQWRAMDFLAIALALRERGFRGHLTAGGHFASFAYRELLRDFPELDTIR